MEKNRWIIAGVLGLVLTAGAVTGCITTGDGQGVEALENMSELEYANWKLYISLGVSVASNRALAANLVSQADLDLAASALDLLRDQNITAGATSLIGPALEEVGLTNDEVALLLLIVEKELLERGALEWRDPVTGAVALSPRTKEILTIVAASLRAAGSVSEADVRLAEDLEAKFNGKIL